MHFLIKSFLCLTSSLLFLGTSFAKEIKYRKRCSIESSMRPKCYHKRKKSILKVALMYYGPSSDMSKEKLMEVKELFEKRFEQSTDGLVGLNIIDIKIIDYKSKMPAGYKFKKITDPKRLQRIYYGENVRGKVMSEAYESYKEAADPKTLRKIDALSVITGAQFEGLGFASGRVSVTEYPMEVAWNLPGGGRTVYPSNYKIVDELIHELGHNMFLGHAGAKCQVPSVKFENNTRCLNISVNLDEAIACKKSNLTQVQKIKCQQDYVKSQQRDCHSKMFLEESKACCEKSPSKNDVMSYCRDRSAVDENTLYGFESCNKSMIRSLVVPAMLQGKQWNIAGRVYCE